MPLVAATPQEYERKLFLLKAETTEGVDSTPTALLNMFQIMDGKSGTEFDKVERKLDRTFWTNQPFTVANKRAFVEGGIELVAPDAPGTDSAHVAPILFPSAMAETKDSINGITRYNPISTAIPSATGYFYHGGILKKVLGGRSNLTGLSLGIGQYFKSNFRFMGSYTDIPEASLPGTIVNNAPIPTSCTYSNSIMVANVLDSSVTDLHLNAKSLSIDFGLDMGPNEYTELYRIKHRNRLATFTARFLRPNRADWDVWAKRDENQLITLAYTLTETNGNLSTLAIRGQVEKVDEVDQDGEYCIEIGGPCIASSAGGDEFYIEFRTP